jgi:hypothetical protein
MSVVYSRPCNNWFYLDTPRVDLALLLLRHFWVMIAEAACDENLAGTTNKNYGGSTMKKSRLVTAMCACIFTCVISSAHAVSYSITDIGSLDGRASMGFSINNSGQVTEQVVLAPLLPCIPLRRQYIAGSGYTGGSGFNWCRY